jgi:hypothetical protein
MSSLPSARHRTLLILGVALLFAPPVPAQRVAPPPPAVYDAQVRYRIRVGRTERINRFLEMIRYLDSIGFRRAPGEDLSEAANPEAERLTGTLPSNKVRDLLRWPNVRTVLLTPQGYRPPENPEQRVLVQIELASGLSPNRQRDLYFQALDHLNRLGFVEKVGFDNQGHTRVLGTIPAGELDLLLKNLRAQPAGWFAPETPPDLLPEPIRDVNPLRVIEVLPEPAGVPPSADVPPPPPPPAGQEFLEKIAPDLREPAAGAGGNLVRMEVVFTREPRPDDITWRSLLLAQPGLTIEGRIGQVVAVLAPPATAPALAALPEVATVRPPRAATRQPPPVPSGRSAAALAATGLDRLHRLNYRGAGVRVAVIDTNFTGYLERLGKELPKDTLYLDLTAARNESLLPDPPAEAAGVARGTLLALAAHLAAPEAQLVLVRLDPAAAYELLTVARYVRGEAFRSDNLVNRNRELLADNDRLRIERARLTEERRALAEEFSQEEAVIQRRRAVAERTADLARREQEYHRRLERFARLEEDLIGLRTVRVVVSPLAWDVGFPANGAGPLCRYLDAVFFQPPRRVFGSLIPKAPPPLWFQAAGNTHGQVWNGPLADADRNGVFEFAPPGAPLPKGRWSPEVNFLAWAPVGVARTAELPAGARVRVALQWTEAHDAATGEIPGPDPYRVPIADLRLLVLKQRDPTGARVATDDFNVVARSARLPQLIEREANEATYEHIVEFTVDAAGHYALRLEGAVPPTTRPASLPTLPAIERTWEPHARLFVEVADPVAFGLGRVVFDDFMPGLGGLGMPGNAKLPRTVGAADAAGWPQPFSAFGAPAGQELLAKPRYLVYDELPLPGVPGVAGTEPAAAFAAGMLASMMSAGVPVSVDLDWMRIPPYGLLRVPPAWLEQVERRWPKTGRE